MHILRHLPLVCLAVVLAGCQTRLAGDYYDPPIAKNPARLHLSGDGSYSFGATYSAEATFERGRWWRIHDRVVMLVPDDKTKPEWFARVARKDALKPLQRSTDVRDLLRKSIP